VCFEASPPWRKKLAACGYPLQLPDNDLPSPGSCSFLRGKMCWKTFARSRRQRGPESGMSLQQQLSVRAVAPLSLSRLHRW
jgi:hypothetical protein